MSRLCFAAALILSFWGSASVWAQEAGCRTRTVPVSVMSGDDSPLPEINKTAFEGSYRGRSVQVNSVTLDQQPRRIFLLLDASASFTDKLDWAFDVADDLVEHVQPPNEIGLAFFATTLEAVVTPTTDRTKIRNEIQYLRSTHSGLEKRVHRLTALWDAVREAVKQLNSHQVGDVILAITDGEDTSSKSNPKELTQILVNSGIRLFAIEVLDMKGFKRRTVQDLNDSDRLYRMVKATGGVAVLSPSLLEFNVVDKHGKAPWGRTVLNSQYQQMLSFYRVNVSFAEPVNEQRDWKLTFTGSEKAAKNHFVLAYPHIVVPCN
jgi:hypothetical protein